VTLNVTIPGEFTNLKIRAAEEAEKHEEAEGRAVPAEVGRE
jgi:hypothetical protein